MVNIGWHVVRVDKSCKQVCAEFTSAGRYPSGIGLIALYLDGQMRFKLEFDIEPPDDLLSIRTPVSCWGSCFAEHMAQKLKRHKYRVRLNPNGIQYNPISIIRSLEGCISEKPFDLTRLFEKDGIWYSRDHHGRFSATTVVDLMEQIEQERLQMKAHLNESGFLLITFGNAWVYEWIQDGRIVANCHKVPQHEFRKRLLSPGEIIDGFLQLTEQYPAILNHRIVLTVSPVRYSKDGLVENNRSKAVLLQAVHTLVQHLKQVYYFPAYEIVIDELRDYRFFDSDMVHPNQQAIQYVYDRFMETVMDEGSRILCGQLESIAKACSHRFLQKDSSEQIRFKESMYQKVSALAQTHPFLDLKEELTYFKADSGN